LEFESEIPDFTSILLEKRLVVRHLQKVKALRTFSQNYVYILTASFLAVKTIFLTLVANFRVLIDSSTAKTEGLIVQITTTFA
jgi:hypothetical protein